VRTSRGQRSKSLQRQLLRLKDQGILIAIVPKNEAGAVHEVFEKHPGMLLKRSDIAAWRVNWTPNSENIRSLSEELNFGTDAFVFIDVSNFEVPEVRAALPTVHVLQVPEKPAEIPLVIPDSGLFQGVQATADDLARTARILEERERSAVTESMSREDFLVSLGLRVTVLPMKGRATGNGQRSSSTRQISSTSPPSVVRRMKWRVSLLRTTRWSLRVRSQIGSGITAWSASWCSAPATRIVGSSTCSS